LFEDEFNGVHKRGLKITERKRSGVWVPTKFGTQIDRWKGAVRFDLDVMEHVSPEWSDEMGGVVG